MTDIYRILTPSEFTSLRDNIPKAKHRILIDTMLNTGARYSELQAFQKHLGWFDAKNNAIVLPATYTKTGRDRTVHLIPAFSKVLSQYIREFKTLDFPRIDTMNENLKRWWYFCAVNCDPNMFCGWYPSNKTFRKTWESWLIFAGYDFEKVALSQGHGTLVQYKHYTQMPATLKSEVEQVKKMTEGWMT